ncbi:glycosyltransferase family 2 protein [Rhizobium sp. Root1220]|uniref:glycosyltransferase family 2 protein n=1 Tax=Rhizobium sp. Root1220 TaxID=1736432 RepID=UPI0009EB5EF2|nr:glycosyltransferase family 2 protein [Rhizobium sp. Root1220]
MPNIVSVILPTFNRSHSLVAAINSVLIQSHKTLELIVVDDASSEDIESVVRGVGDSRVSYVRRPQNGGAGAARNTGLGYAKGDYIAFQDSDDVWLPNKLERQLELLSSLPEHVGVVTGAKIVYYGPTRILHAPPPEGRLSVGENQLARLLTENRISVQNALFRKGCFPGTHWFDECASANEDWEFAIRLAQHTTIYEDLAPVVLGFISADSISMNTRKELIGYLRILRKNRHILKTLKTQRSLLMIGASRYFFKLGKTTTARKFLLASFLDNPPNIRLLISPAFKRAAYFILGGQTRREIRRKSSPS